jgi:16S rRNA C967 or C1407 C5-methylase (RsmB/RsmF family)
VNIPDPFSTYQNIIPDFNSFLEHLTSPLPAYIRLNTLKAPESSIINRLKKEGIILEKTGIDGSSESRSVVNSMPDSATN